MQVFFPKNNTRLGESVLDTAEVQTLLCLLRVLDNAHQDIPMTGALLSPIFGVRAGALAKLRSADRQTELWDAAAASAMRHSASGVSRSS